MERRRWCRRRWRGVGGQGVGGGVEGIYIVEISSQLLYVLLQPVSCLQAILEETGQQREPPSTSETPAFSVNKRYVIVSNERDREGKTRVKGS